MGNIITIDKNQIAVFKEEAGKLVLKKEAENELVKLLDTIDLLNDTLDHVKEQILQGGQKISPDFKGVVGAKVKAIAREYGSKYSVTQSTKENEQFVNERITQTVNGSGVDQFISKHGRLPKGITELKRTKKLTITRT